jgi:hypothetical protein
MYKAPTNAVISSPKTPETKMISCAFCIVATSNIPTVLCIIGLPCRMEVFFVFLLEIMAFRAGS